MNWIHKYANKAAKFWSDDGRPSEYLLEMADLLNDTTFVKNADPSKGIKLLNGSVRRYAWNGEKEDWTEEEQMQKDFYIIALEFYASTLENSTNYVKDGVTYFENGAREWRPKRPAISLLNNKYAASPTEAGKRASVKTVRAIAYDMKEIFGFINNEWLAQLMSAATGNEYTRDRIRKRIGDMK